VDLLENKGGKKRGQNRSVIAPKEKEVQDLRREKGEKKLQVQ